MKISQIILLSAMQESLNDELQISSVHLRLLTLRDNSSNAVLGLEVDAFEVANHGKCNVVADSGQSICFES